MPPPPRTPPLDSPLEAGASELQAKHCSKQDQAKTVETSARIRERPLTPNEYGKLRRRSSVDADDPPPLWLSFGETAIWIPLMLPPATGYD